MTGGDDNKNDDNIDVDEWIPGSKQLYIKQADQLTMYRIIVMAQNVHFDP